MQIFSDALVLDPSTSSSSASSAGAWRLRLHYAHAAAALLQHAPLTLNHSLVRLTETLIVLTMDDYDQVLTRLYFSHMYS